MNYIDDSLMLHTDLYQINMAETYWHDGIHNRNAVFDLYFRKLPFGNGYGVYAGLERIIEYLHNFRFSESDLTYLKDLGYKEDFIDHLRDLRFTGSLKSMREGEIVFANEPIVRVEAPLEEAQLLETALLNIVNYQTLIATKASRIRQLVRDNPVMEFGTRRAQEMDAAVWGTRAAYIGGFSATSNVRAGKLFGIPVSGTHAHSMVQAYRDEYVAFKKYAERHRECVFLVDTYDTLYSGVPNAIKVAKELGDKIDFKGIRIDSGDLAYLSKEARRMMDEAGFTDAKIYVSNDLDEYTIASLQAQHAQIDVWGIGTKLITAYDQPALGAVYKLVSIEDEQGEMVDTIKLSGNPEKMTTPGKKKVYRIINKGNHHTEGDYLTLEDEDPNQEAEIMLFHPIHTYYKKMVSNFDAVDLHHDIAVNGQIVYECPSLLHVQNYAKNQLQLFWDEYKRTNYPAEYPVDLSIKLWNNKMEHIENVKKKVKQDQNL
ncbi:MULTISPECIES: nicotinate phosphoribosyltransferase [Oceanobacillus]|uniref:Nicotinate phosphoribosyltransferase n=1 Tax=Oceanobacillus sojae TaxID=582851 RepID=A0A511ZK10_9BACI|nr:nicotinate phosphoribosyltransferase [Oceanobacillus sojae]GEN87784.1 nicotinate phosphoribosyltransferase [Oceanobacillus sojae]